MADQFTEQQVAHFRVLFNLFDKDHDEAISTKDLGTLIRALGQNPTQGELNDLTSEISSESGTIDFPEFLTLLARQMRNSGDEEKLREAFRIFDKEGDGLISVEELTHIMTNLGEKVPMDEVNEMMKEVEVTAEGLINYEELVTTMFTK